MKILNILSNKMLKLDFKFIQSQSKKLLIKNGANEFSANSVSLGLSETSLRGVDSHGIRLLPHYLNALRNGRINGKPKFQINKKTPCFIGLDADNAFGHAAGFKSIDLGIDIASEFGICAISVFNSSHPGAMASFALKAAKKDLCCFAFTHADSLIQSFNSKDVFFGTNPICFAAPRANEEPFCVDMAPTYAPWNKILDYQEKGLKLENNIAINSHGEPTINPEDAKALLPIAGYKGYALASLVEVLCASLSGMNYGPNIPSMYGSSIKQSRKLGQFYILMRPDINVDLDEFAENLHKMSEDIRNQKSQNDKSVLVPNDPQIIESKKRLKNGIPVSSEIYRLLSF
tara:strand:- start:1498 stop:2532 length:1035 start_codon:yes stop_codon:yes gene_type:complete